MIDTQRLGALLRALIRDDAQAARLRTPPVASVRAAAGVGPELAPPLLAETTPEATPRDPAREAPRPGTPLAARQPDVERDTVHIASRLAGELPAAAPGGAHEEAGALIPSRASAPAPDARSLATASAAPSTSAALDLSDTGRALLAALRGVTPANAPTLVPGSAMQPVSGASARFGNATVAQALGSRNPLISVPHHSEVATDRLALQLKDAVEFSGVFYEAHLAQWADDMRPRALLAHEPQSRWPVVADIAQRVVAAEAAPADYAAPVLRHQLEVLDTGRFVWRGDLWPGQPGILVIEEDDPPPQRAGVLDEPSAPRWRMRLWLEFPGMGVIDASVALSGERVELGLQCDNADVAARLRTAGPALRVAIAERALDLASLTVSHDRAA